MHLTLFIPELIWPEPDDADVFARLDAPALGTLIARASEQRAPGDGLDALIARHFGLASPFPFAALRLLGEGHEAGDAVWLAADPVHLSFHQERLILAGAEHLAIDADEAALLLDALNAEFSDIGTFIATTPAHWYVRLARACVFDAESPHQRSGRRLDRQLPETAELAWLRRFLNEAQMRLHLHPVNERRAEEGRQPINSLWLWGAGTLPERAVTNIDGIWSERPVDRGLARQAGIAAFPAPAGFADWIRQPTGSAPLIVIEDLIAAAQQEDGAAWRAALHAIDSHWLSPALAAARSGRLNLTVCAPTSYGVLRWTLAPRDGWRLWRRARPLQDTAKRLARGGA